MIKVVPARDEITLNVCQGIGDIMWVYQKFCWHFRKINFNIMTVGNADTIQTRAKEFLKIFPQVGKVETISVTGNCYEKTANTYCPMSDIFKSDLKTFDYACNHPLEQGIRIEDIDPYACASSISVPFIPYIKKDYVLAYVSGSTKNSAKHGSWELCDWFDFISLFYEKFNITTPLVLIGANYDREVQTELSKMLIKNKIESSVHIDLEPKTVTGIIKNAKIFLAYQSGLSILADMLDTKQVMLYYHWLEKLMYSWCKKDHIDSIYQPFLWSDPAKIVSRLS
jgi:hypothetical protein